MNYVRIHAVKYRLFKDLPNEMGSEFEALLYHCNVRRLSCGKVASRVFALHEELALFLHTHVCKALRRVTVRISYPEFLSNYMQIFLFLKSHHFGKCSHLIFLYIIGYDNI